MILLALLLVGGGVFFAVRSARRGRPTTDEPWPARAAPPGDAPGTSQAPTTDAGSTEHVAQARRARAPRRPGAGWAIETHGLTKRFGTNVAVDDVELLVPRGCAFGCLGPNGAGKTTLIRTLLGLTHADAGTMRLLGIDVPAERHRALAKVGAIVDEPRFHGHLTGVENLRMLAAARGADAEPRILPSLERVGLLARGDDRVSSYSMGMRQRLGVAACLLGDPELLVLDEPMNGLDPAGMQEMRTMIDALVDEGRTVMLSSHLLDEVERTCEAVAILDRGRVIRQGTIAELVHGAGAMIVRVECDDPARGAAVLSAIPSVVEVAPANDDAIAVTMQAGSTREEIAELDRVLVREGLKVYGLEEVQATLEEWFLSVTGRLGDPR